VIRFNRQIKHLIDSVLAGPGHADPALRQAVAARASELSGGGKAAQTLPDPLGAWVEKVAKHAYKTLDSDVETLKQSYSEDQIFELTIAAATGAAHTRFELALAAIIGERQMEE
jgi:alkylhydroperoxidase family enzyme